MPHMIYQSHLLRRFRRQSNGVALVITLAMLTIVSLLAIAFVMTARTELKSGSAYNDQVAAKSLAKMAMDRALMEIVRQGAGEVISGGSNSVIRNYAITDFSKIDNYTNDTINPLYGVANGMDFVERDSQSGRSPTEPYWISVRNTDGVLVGRFAYIARGNVVDINGIGNIAGPSDTYQRGNGYIGTLSISSGATNYTRGICSDVSLQKFLEKLGYTNATDSARRILWFRYGWNPSGPTPTPGSGLYLPGIEGVDNNQDGVINNPSEYTVTPTTVGNDQAIGSLDQLDAASNPIAPDPAHTNLADYATAGTSADPNLVNPYVGPRVNLNAMLTTNDVPTLTNVLAQFSQFTPAQRLQLAVNLIDFHTTNRYPTVYVSGTNAPSLTNTFIGVKATPYLNQVVISNRVILTATITTNTAGPAKCPTSYFVNVSSTIIGEIWQPYTTPFPDLCQLVVTGVTTRSAGAATATVNLNSTNAFTNSFAGPINNSPSFAYNIAATSLSSNMVWGSNIAAAANVTITQIVRSIKLSGIPSLGTTNPISQISNVPFTNIQTWTWASVGLPAKPTLTNFACNAQTNYWFMSLEADDPRISLLYTQSDVSANCNLGAINVTCSPNAANAYTGYTDTGNREGTASFYVQTNDYVTIGDIGYVHRGEPWATIRLQPGGDGILLDYFRVNDLIDVAGRININSDVDGPLGVHQSPAFFALFSGVTNSAYGTITDAKILNIIAEIDNYRSGLTNNTMSYIGQMCDITNLVTGVTDFGPAFSSPPSIPYTADANREALIRAISNLITAWKGGGTTEIIGWGQVVKGGSTGVSNGVPGAVVAIQAKFKNEGGRIKLTSFQYVPQ